MASLGVEWEWIVVDDHSRDDTFAVLQRLSAADARVRGVRFARNSGSHVAIACGMHLASGDAVVMMAADLQDPPETIGAMVERWSRGAQVVWAVRRVRPGDRCTPASPRSTTGSCARMVGLREMPARGADFFLAIAASSTRSEPFPSERPACSIT